MQETDPKLKKSTKSSGNSPPETVSPAWPYQARLIGYGHYSLVFRPPVLLPNSSEPGELERAIAFEPDRFVGMITTENRYHGEIEPSVGLLKRLRLRCQGLGDFTVLPCTFAVGRNHLLLSDRNVQNLVEQHHAVKKRVDYQKTWQEKTLVQVIYPFAGNPLENYYRRPDAAPSWTDFFEGMLGIADCIQSLHAEDYVHGDLSPNNLLFEATEDGSKRFTIVDWNMACKAESFLEHLKEEDRVGCWSPEHFSLTTTRRCDLARREHWRIYDEEMRKYLNRMLEFTLSPQPEMVKEVLDRQVEPSGDKGKPSGYHEMFDELLAMREDNPSSIGKYHDLRYFMDTIAKSVANMFRDIEGTRLRSYHRFMALVLAQNLSSRSPFLEKPELLARRLSIVLRCCAISEGAQRPDKDFDPPPSREESTLLDLLRSPA
jgi:hypothetical protein